VDIETDKVVLEVVAPADGSLSEILKGEGDTVLSNEVIAVFVEGAAAAPAAKQEAKAEAPAAEAKPAASGEKLVNPAARKMASENNVNPADVSCTGKDGRVTKEDVANHLKSAPANASASKATAPAVPAMEAVGDRVEKRVPMTHLRKRIAERLLEASNHTATMTMLNVVNMEHIMELRAKYKDQFEKAHNDNRQGFR